MHELGIVFHVIKSVEKIGEENGLTNVASVTLELGEVSGAIPHELESCWNWAVKKTELLPEAALKIETIPAVTYCEGCGRDYPTVQFGRTCPHCGQMCLPRCAHDTLAFSCYNSSIGKTRIKMQTFRIIAKNPSHENAASKLVLAAVRFFILAVLIRFKQHSAPPYETTFLPFFSLPLSARRCAMI